ncbi:hypothetical protein MTsPCn5_28640 [Croceitalea sp. MTPC5]|uniref:hypothetical protein n=1 Tax=Croceitalea sp. MTPC5 TaxID=3056565 RepID=UPI002B3E9289|nr:hypothetical protein MTsPCn5_28640 [Croceitalea sp. MTPC5]
MLSEKLMEELSKGALILFLATTLLGGHLTASYLFLEPNYPVRAYYGYVALLILVINTLYFLMSLAFQFSQLPNKQGLMKSALCLLINIPITILYIVILIAYEI